VTTVSQPDDEFLCASAVKAQAAGDQLPANNQ
jgi:hypothetical protein